MKKCVQKMLSWVLVVAIVLSTVNLPSTYIVSQANEIDNESTSNEGQKSTRATRTEADLGGMAKKKATEKNTDSSQKKKATNGDEDSVLTSKPNPDLDGSVAAPSGFVANQEYYDDNGNWVIDTLGINFDPSGMADISGRQIPKATKSEEGICKDNTWYMPNGFKLSFGCSNVTIDKDIVLGRDLEVILNDKVLDADDCYLTSDSNSTAGIYHFYLNLFPKNFKIGTVYSLKLKDKVSKEGKEYTVFENITNSQWEFPENDQGYSIWYADGKATSTSSTSVECDLASKISTQYKLKGSTKWSLYTGGRGGSSLNVYIKSSNTNVDPDFKKGTFVSVDLGTNSNIGGYLFSANDSGVGNYIDLSKIKDSLCSYILTKLREDSDTKYSGIEQGDIYLCGDPGKEPQITVELSVGIDTTITKYIVLTGGKRNSTSTSGTEDSSEGENNWFSDSDLSVSMKYSMLDLTYMEYAKGEGYLVQADNGDIYLTQKGLDSLVIGVYLKVNSQQIPDLYLNVFANRGREAIFKKNIFSDTPYGAANYINLSPGDIKTLKGGIEQYLSSEPNRELSSLEFVISDSDEDYPEHKIVESIGIPGAWHLDLDTPTLEIINKPTPVATNGTKSYFKVNNGVKPKLGIKSTVGSSGIKSVSYGSTVLGTDVAYTIDLVEGSNQKVALENKLGVKVEENLGYNTVVFDTAVPTITGNPTITPKHFETEEGSIDVYDRVVSYKINFSDETEIKNASLKVNGKEVLSSVGSNTKLVTFEFTTGDSTKKYFNAEGNYEIEASIEDWVGNTATKSWNIQVDQDPPQINKEACSLSENFSNVKGVSFFKAAPTLTLSAADRVSGIAEYKLYKLGEEGDEWVLSSTDGVFENHLDSGSYEVEVIDNIGSSTGRIPLSEIITGLKENIIVDTEAPTINVKIPANGGIGASEEQGGWFSGLKENFIPEGFEVTVSDETGLMLATIEVNGKTVLSPKFEGLDETEFTFDESSLNIASILSKVGKVSNGAYTIKVTVLDNAENAYTWEYTIYIDSERPTVDKFTITGDGYQEGEIVTLSEDYGFYFREGATCTVDVSDGEVTSGVEYITVKFTTVDGKEEIKNFVIEEDGTSTFAIPKEYKGYIDVSVTDKVGNTSSFIKPDGFISEESNTAINNIGITIDLPETPYTDTKGNNLYPNNVGIKSTIDSPISGIRTIEWGIGEETRGKIDVDNKGNATGTKTVINATEKNLVVNLSDAMNVSDNKNDNEIWVKVTDRTGYTSTASKVFSIDKDAPIISVSYDINGKEYLNTSRAATIKVTDRNFDANQVVYKGTIGEVGTWVNTEGDTWVNTMTFNEDNDYRLSVYAIDKAGNVSRTVTGSSFTIDKTNPTISVSWDNNNVINGKYYNNTRTATVKIVDHNFNPYNIKMETAGGKITPWEIDGDSHVMKIFFGESGTENQLSISGTDKAGNSLAKYTSEVFVLDLEPPTISIEGIQEGISYKENVFARAVVTDPENMIDTSKTKATLTGSRIGNVPLTGGVNPEGGTYTLNGLPVEDLYDGLYTLYITAVDMGGNMVESEIKFFVNRFGSLYEFIPEDMLNTYINESTDVVIEEYNVNEVNLDAVNVIVLMNGEKIDVDKERVLKVHKGMVDGKYVYSYTINRGAFTEDGKYSVQVYSSSLDGTEYSSISEEYSFVLDTTAPSVIVSGIESGKTYNEESRHATIEIKDLSGLNDSEGLVVKLNGSRVDYKEDNGVYAFDINKKSDKQSVEVVAIDRAGNQSEVRVDEFMIDTDVATNATTMAKRMLSDPKGKIALVVIGVIVFLALLGLGVFFLGRNKKYKAELDSDLEEYYSSSTGSSDDDE